MKKIAQYWQPTPKKARVLGDSILILSAAISGSIMGLPIAEHTKLWLMFSINVISAIGKILTNFATEPDKEPVL